MMYKCPYCGKVTTSMYCDVCEKSIPRSCTVDAHQMDGKELAEASNHSIDEIKATLKNLTYSVSEIRRKVQVIYVVTIICIILSLLGAIFGIVEMVKIANLFR